MARSWTLRASLVWWVFACADVLWAGEGFPAAPLRGEYGFLTVYDGITEQEARTRIQQMVKLFNVKEFQFYDAFRGYSNPPDAGDDFWHNKAFGRPVRSSILRAYVDEIRAQGGRSWLYVQAAATTPGDTYLQQGFALAGQHVVDNRPLLDAVAPNGPWAEKIAPRWGDFAVELGFSGIHWDTLGKFSAVMETQTDLPGFLRAAKGIVASRGLEQSANFVDGFGWDPSLVDDNYPGGRVILFPYWETWTMPVQEDFFFNQVAPNGGGVFVCYPGKSVDHTGEWQNQGSVGIWPFDLLIMRWNQARSTGNAYLAIGDGIRHIDTQYFPANSPMSDEDVAKVRTKVFNLPTSPSDFETSLGAPAAAAPAGDAQPQAPTTQLPTEPPTQAAAPTPPPWAPQPPPPAYQAWTPPPPPPPAAVWTYTTPAPASAPWHQNPPRRKYSVGRGDRQVEQPETERSRHVGVAAVSLFMAGVAFVILAALAAFRAELLPQSLGNLTAWGRGGSGGSGGSGGLSRAVRSLDPQQRPFVGSDDWASGGQSE